MKSFHTYLHTSIVLRLENTRLRPVPECCQTTWNQTPWQRSQQQLSFCIRAFVMPRYTVMTHVGLAQHVHILTGVNMK